MDCYWADCTVFAAPSLTESFRSFSMYACTDLHSARMLPSPKPVAPLLSISSRKKVSSANMGLVNTWRRYLKAQQKGKDNLMINERLLPQAFILKLKKKSMRTSFSTFVGILGCIVVKAKIMGDTGASGCNSLFVSAAISLRWGVLVQVCVQKDPVLRQRLRAVSRLLYFLLFSNLSQQTASVQKGVPWWFADKIITPITGMLLITIKGLFSSNLCVVGRRGGEKLDTSFGHRIGSRDYVVGVQADVLDPRCLVLLQEGVDLVAT